MSSDIAIRLSGVGKAFRMYDQPADRLKQMLLRGMKTYYRDFWALRDVNLDVACGECVGIIGRNGAGKSTLLQIIAGTLQPTTGTVEVSGRVAALLELGSGFNPEFTGRENVFLNASILGLAKEETEARFDEIVNFADIGDFLDRPVKTYSSGMMVRLAFAVQVLVDPDVLIVDEALSVGDIAYRNKCMRRIRDLHDKGVAIFFASHDIGTVQMICDRVVWLEGGKVQRVGNSVEVSQDFYASQMGLRTQQYREISVADAIPQVNTGVAEFIDFRIDASTNGGSLTFQVGRDISVRFALRALESLEQPVMICISVFRSDGDWILGQTSRDVGVFWPAIIAGQTMSGTITLPKNCLAPGDYFASIAADSKDFKTRYAHTELDVQFSVRSSFPTWGRFIHPCVWTVR
jgi:ABC-type polysaccharide/polyol phosphate transport system ATPase subunit